MDPSSCDFCPPNLCPGANKNGKSGEEDTLDGLIKDIESPSNSTANNDAASNLTYPSSFRDTLPHDPTPIPPETPHSRMMLLPELNIRSNETHEDDEDQEDTYEPTSWSPTANDNNYTTALRRRRNLGLTALCLLCIAIVAIVLGVTLTRDNNDRGVPGFEDGNDILPTTAPSSIPSMIPSSIPSEMPSIMPTSSPTMKPSHFPVDTSTALALLLIENSVYDGSEFEDPGSYQSLALKWLESSTSSGGNMTNEILLQRYALASLYYSTFEVDTDMVADAAPWTNSDGWLSETSECDWFGIECDASTGAVQTIALDGNGLTGSFPKEITLLSASLTSLALSDNQIYNSGEEGNAWLGELTALESLDLADTFFENDGIPTEIGLLTSLTDLDLSYTLYSGPLTNDMWTELRQLEEVEISGNSYNSSVPKNLSTLRQLQYLYIYEADLTGGLDFMVEFRSMVECWFDDNPNLKGTIPSGIVAFASFASLSLVNTGTTGSLPSELGLLTLMDQVWLYTNEITGTIPTEFGAWSNLLLFQLEGNNVNGTMPEEICALVAPAGGALTSLTADCDEVTCACCTECY